MADTKKKNNDKELSYAELVARRDELKQKYMELRFKMIVSHVDNPMEKRNMRREIARLNTFITQKAAAQKAEAAARRKKERQIAETEAAIAALEAQQAELEELLALPENQTQENFQRYESVKHQIEQKLYEWEILSE